MKFLGFVDLGNLAQLNLRAFDQGMHVCRALVSEMVGKFDDAVGFDLKENAT